MRLDVARRRRRVRRTRCTRWRGSRGRAACRAPTSSASDRLRECTLEVGQAVGVGVGDDEADVGAVGRERDRALEVGDALRPWSRPGAGGSSRGTGCRRRSSGRTSRSRLSTWIACAVLEERPAREARARERGDVVGCDREPVGIAGEDRALGVGMRGQDERVDASVVGERHPSSGRGGAWPRCGRGSPRPRSAGRR